MEPGTKLTSDTAMTASHFPYQELVGCLMYLAVSTRTDIAYATNCLARFVCTPNNNHVHVAKRVLKYLQGTKSVGIWLGERSPNFLKGYCDANYGGCEETRRSTTGYVFTFHGRAGVESAQALVPGRSDTYRTMTEFRSSTFEDNGTH
eukprot:scaffold101_cov567-Pavlova_lutheri.AAC.2